MILGLRAIGFGPKAKLNIELMRRTSSAPPWRNLSA
jgi:hypothetical protein